VFKPFVQTIVLITLITLVSACGPAATSVPPTATAVPAPTMPPTIVLISATATPISALNPPQTMVTPLSTAVPALEGRIVFYSERDGNAEIYVMAPDGSALQRLTQNAADDITPAWSPDGQLIVFESDRDDPQPRKCFPNCDYNLYVMNADGSALRRLTAHSSPEGHASWSPDGAQVVFETDRNGDGKGELYTVSVSGGEPQPLLDDEYDNRAADWSPDGRQIAFMSNRDGTFDIYVMASDGSAIRKLADTGLNDYFPDWSPDGQQIVFFAADWPTVKQDIYIINADGSDLRKLTDTPRTVDEDPAWSPDSRQLVFQSDRSGAFDIYTMNADGSNPQPLTRNAGQNYWPDWSAGTAPQTRSSGRIAFISDRDGQPHLYLMSADGSQQQRLTRLATEEYAPSWSPDGAQLAYYTHLTAQSWVIMVVNVDNAAEPRALTEAAGDTVCSFAPLWSPDGRRIAFTVEPNPKPTCEMKHSEIAVMDADGHNVQFLTHNDANDLAVAWSPDGAQLLFISDRDGKNEIYWMSVDGDASGTPEPRRLTDTDSTNFMPSLSPDGQQIAFVSNRDGDDEIYVMKADGANPTRLTRRPGWDWGPTWSSDGREIVFVSKQGGDNLDIFVMQADGANIRQLTDSPGWDFEPVWQPQ